MGTRAVYIFEKGYKKTHVYKHDDNEPNEGIQYIKNAFKFSWELPRYEPEEFAAAFVAANKKEPGDISLIDHVPSVNYLYKVTYQQSQLWLQIFDYVANDIVYNGFLKDFG